MEEDILTAPQVAKILGVTSASINAWCKDGLFPNAWRLNPSRPKSHWRIPRRDVNSFIEARRKERGFFYMPTNQSPRSAHTGSQRNVHAGPQHSVQGVLPGM